MLLKCVSVYLLRRMVSPGCCSVPWLRTSYLKLERQWQNSSAHRHLMVWTQKWGQNDRSTLTLRIYPYFIRINLL